MTIDQNMVVTLNYTLKDSEGAVIDSSEGQEPLVYLHGVGSLISGLESELKGKKKGEKIKAVISPEDAYGERKNELLQEVPKSGFQGKEELVEGMQVQVQMGEGTAIASISKVEGDKVTLDMNHPLAGMTLHFDVDILDIRKATLEEISHGHAHGPGGHQH